MNSIKNYLTNHLGKEVEALRKITRETQESLEALINLNLDNADYKVDLHSLWAEEGEKSVSHLYRGSLRKAVKTAEEKFMKKNNRSDVQAIYSVAVYLDKLSFEIPAKFWNKYKQRR